MTPRPVLCALVIAGVLAVPSTARAQAQRLLVTCTADGCEFQRIATLLVAGKTSVRGLAATAEKIGPASLRGSRELKAEQLAGLERDAVTGAFYALTPQGQRRELVVPASASIKAETTPAAVWSGVPLEHRATPNAKTGTPVTAEHFAFLIVSANAEESALQLLQRLIDAPQADPRRDALIRSGVQFSAKSPALQQWRTRLVASIKDRVSRFEQQDGDPSLLAAALREATQLRAIYLQVADKDSERALLDRVAAADDLFNRRRVIADVLRSSAYWDEYLTKTRQMGLAKWSIQGVLEHEKEARTQTVTLHRRRATGFTEAGQLDRAFDEAQQAASNSCQASVSDEFYRVRVLLVNQAQIEAASEYTGSQKALLEQIVRELDELDPQKEQLTLDRIRQGEALDPGFLPLQLKKAEFFDKLGRYSEALRVVQRVERDIRLDRKQLDEYLRLDGRITNNLLDAIQKSQQETNKAFDAQQFQAALTAAGRGLKADSSNPTLLYHSALAAAFLRQKDVAIEFIKRYLRDANPSCTAAEETAKILDLYRLLLANVATPPPANTIPNWVSGARYRPEDAPYDPVSMSLLQPIQRIVTDDGFATVFVHEDRSFLVKSIETNYTKPSVLATSPRPPFEVEPKYDRKTLSMVEIGPRGTSAGERTVYPLTYLTSPGVDPDLVFRFTGKQIARGWAGNPFFHPFVWNGIYIFDLAYDQLGRLATATPVQENAGSRADPFSEPLQFTWEGDSKRLLSIRGTRSGYVRELTYKNGRLDSERVSYPKGNGSIEYQYASDAANVMIGAKSSDNFFDKKEREVLFDPSFRVQ